MSLWRWGGNHGARDRALAVLFWDVSVLCVNPTTEEKRKEREGANLISVYDIETRTSLEIRSEYLSRRTVSRG